MAETHITQLKDAINIYFFFFPLLLFLLIALVSCSPVCAWPPLDQASGCFPCYLLLQENCRGKTLRELWPLSSHQKVPVAEILSWESSISHEDAFDMELKLSRLTRPLLPCVLNQRQSSKQPKANLAQFLLFLSGENSIKNWLMLEFSSRINKFLMRWKWIVSEKQLSLFCIVEKKKKYMYLATLVQWLSYREGEFWIPWLFMLF